MTETLTPALDQLATPLLWLEDSGRVRDCNAAFCTWLSLGKRRLQGMDIDQLDHEAPRLRELCRQCRQPEDRILAHRLQLSFGGQQEHFADAIVVREADGWRVEWHPRAEFDGADPALALPAALSLALKGLAHELRNPLAGLKGAAQLLHKKTGDYDPSLPDVLGDADRLTQAVLNLVRNALQSGASAVSLRSRAEHHVQIADTLSKLALRIEIADNGRGVPEDLHEQIFLPLVSGRAEGTGLGLPLALQIAREHRGSLSFRSRPGHTVFTLLLPVPEVTP